MSRRAEKIHITDIEAALNFLRAQYPSPDGVQLRKPLGKLAEVYALMAFYGEMWVAAEGFPAEAMQAWLEWYDSTPDTPCIAICSTAQGDAICKGCGRSEDEVQYWQSMGAVAKREVWQRITVQDSAWRFNKYAERAQEKLREREADDAASANKLA